jgi:secretion/DNA translocation related CpaE-like protein
VVLVSADPQLSDRIAGLAAAAGLPLAVATDPHDVRLREVPSVVLLGADLTSAVLARAAPLRRPGVIVVALGDVAAQTWQDAVALGAEQVAVLPEAEPWLLERLLDAASPRPTGRVAAVVGGRGGAGASTLATALAITTAAAGTRTMLVDLDPFGGGLDLVLGAEYEAGLRWEDLASARGRLQPGLLGTGLPQFAGVRFLTWSRREQPGEPTAAVPAVLDAAVRESDLVLLDLPRRVDEAARAALKVTDRVLLVVPAEVRATAAAGQVLAALEPLTADIRLVVRGPAPTGLTADAVAEALGLPLAGELRAEPGLAVALDRGLAPPLRSRGPLAVLCRRLAADLKAA